MKEGLGVLWGWKGVREVLGSQGLGVLGVSSGVGDLEGGFGRF